MSFKSKVLIANIILISILISVIGYFLIRNSYNTSLNAQINTTMEENQLIKSNIEAEVVSMAANGEFDSINRVAQLGDSLSTNMEGTNIMFSLLDSDKNMLYSNYDNPIIEKDILGYLEIEKKQYIIEKIDDKYILSVASYVKVKNQLLYIVNISDISSVYAQTTIQIRYFQLLMIVGIIICSIVLYIMANWLTKPIYRLNDTASRITDGDYSIRTNITSEDEIGELAGKFDKMAEAIEDHVNELTDVARQREDFVANFTHEIKTPLTAVIGYADMLRSKELNQEDKFMAANYIFTEGKRLENMSMKLFDLLLIGKKDIDKSDINMPLFIDEIKLSVKPMLENKDITLETSMENAVIKGDKELLKTVFINVIDNAKKASDNGSVINSIGQIINGEYIVEIIDTGIGFPDEEVNKVFEAFYMVDKSRSRREGGAGLGLSLAMEIVKLHEGNIHISSEVGKGTRVMLTFPIKEETYNA